MGQRLNLEIHSNGERLANSYYHWSGYTGSTADLVTQVIMNLEYAPAEMTDKQKAVWLLYKTGARFDPEEFVRIHENNIDLSDYSFAVDDKVVDRSDGLLAITKEGMDQTEYWEEAHAEVDITNQTVFFGPIYSEIKTNFEQEYEEDTNDYPVFDIREDLTYSFEEWPAFYNKLISLISERHYSVKSGDGETIYSFIE